MNNLKVLLSAVVAGTIFVLHSLSVYGAPTGGASAEARLPDQKGILTSSGQVSINGNAVETGATVISGSLVTTGPGSFAIVNVADLGRITLGPVTSATITFADGNIVVKTTCADLRVAVRQGAVSIQLPDGSLRMLSSGQEESYGGNLEVIAYSGSDVVVNCARDGVPQPSAPNTGGRGGLLFGRAGWLGLLLLGAVAVGIATVVTNSGSSSPRQPVSGFRP